MLHAVLCLIAAGMVVCQLLNSDDARSPKIHDLMTRFMPDDGWVMLGIGVAFLLICLLPARRPGREELLQ